MSAGDRLVTVDQANALAELYVWATVQEILEGGTAPRTHRGQRAAARVLKICFAQQQRCLDIFDKPEKKGNSP